MTKQFLAATAFALAALFLAGEALAESCLAEVSEAEANRLAEHCRAVSPATRPPCNPENDCRLVTEEILRGCAMLGEDAPAFCADYEGE